MRQSYIEPVISAKYYYAATGNPGTACYITAKDRTTQGFNTPGWAELRFDIDESVNPDLVGTMTAYTSPAGPITPLDILYGYRPPMARGNLFMAHRCGFTEKVLIGTLQQAGFQRVASKRRPHPFYDLWAVATVGTMEETPLRALAAEHIPG